VGSGDHREPETIGVPEGKDGQPYYLPDDMADKTIEWLHGVRAQDQDKPFVYFSTGCSHDNGSSMEVTLTGSFNELTMQNGIPLTPEQQLALVQRYGGWRCGVAS
jgi:hypothetical protein